MNHGNARSFCRILYLQAPRDYLLPNKFHGNVVTNDIGRMTLDFHWQYLCLGGFKKEKKKKELSVKE